MPQSISWSATGAPIPRQPHLGALVRRAVEALGKGALDVGDRQPAVLRGDRHRSVIGDLRQDPLQRGPIVGADFEQGVARIVPRLADRDALDAKRAAVVENAVEDLRQHEAVDDVSLDLDLFALDGCPILGVQRDGIHGIGSGFGEARQRRLRKSGPPRRRPGNSTTVVSAGLSTHGRISPPRGRPGNCSSSNVRARETTSYASAAGRGHAGRGPGGDAGKFPADTTNTREKLVNAQGISGSILRRQDP